MITHILISISLLIYLSMLYHSYRCDEITCLSDIAYDRHGYVFPLCMALMDILITISIMKCTDVQYRWLCYIMFLSIVGVISLPYRKNRKTYLGHYVSALLSFASITLLWYFKGMWFIPLFFCVSSLRKKWLLGVEMALIASALLYVFV